MARKSIGLSDRGTLRLNFSGAKTSNEDAQSGWLSCYTVSKYVKSIDWLLHSRLKL